MSVLVLLGLGVTRTSRGFDHIGEDVLSCEEAIAHLADCCPGFDPTRVRCVHYESEGCDPDPDRSFQHPALNVADSQCVRASSCDVLRATGVCDRAQVAQSRDGYRGYEKPQPTVCP